MARRCSAVCFSLRVFQGKETSVTKRVSAVGAEGQELNIKNNKKSLFSSQVFFLTERTKRNESDKEIEMKRKHVGEKSLISLFLYKFLHCTFLLRKVPGLAQS